MEKNISESFSKENVLPLYTEPKLFIDNNISMRLFCSFAKFTDNALKDNRTIY